MLLTAFGQTLAHWTNASCVLFILIINGREAIFEDVDLSRTVGHFALGHPVILNMTDAHTPTQALSNVKEQLARIPNHGISHGLLRLTELEDVKSKVKKLNEDSYRDKVVFNYILFMGGASSGDAVFRPAKSMIDLSEDSQNKRDYVLKCTASIFQERLVFNWEYSANLHRADTIKTNAQFYLRALMALAF